MRSHPHLIKEPPKQAHQVLLFQIKQILKDLINVSQFRYGRDVMVPYWVSQFPSQGLFPKNTLFTPCSEYEVDGGSTTRHGVLDISRAHIVSITGAFVEGMLQPFVCNATFFQALYLHFFFVFYDPNIECYVQWKEKKHRNAT
jgi:hypothetical protein